MMHNLQLNSSNGLPLPPAGKGSKAQNPGQQTPVAPTTPVKPLASDTLQLPPKAASTAIPATGIRLKPMSELLNGRKTIAPVITPPRVAQVKPSDQATFTEETATAPQVAAPETKPQTPSKSIATKMETPVPPKTPAVPTKENVQPPEPPTPASAAFSEEAPASTHTTDSATTATNPTPTEEPSSARTALHETTEPIEHTTPPIKMTDIPLSETPQVKADAKVTAPGKTPLARYVYQMNHQPEARAEILKAPTGGAFLDALEHFQVKGRLSKADVMALQNHLVQHEKIKLSYKGHKTGIDGLYGNRTQRALELYLAKNAPAEALTNPGATESPYPRYDKMFQDGVLDVTVAIGYDEPVGPWAGANIDEENKVDQQLVQRGYTADPDKVKELLQAAGREIKGNYQGLYVKENIATQNGKPVHGIVRVVKAGRADMNNGTEARNAALEAMNQSDAFLYGGHARYGSGPDFDRNYKVTIDWTDVPNAPATGKVTYDDYDGLKKLLSQQGNHAEAIAKFDELEKQGRIGFETSNAGNVIMNKQNKHPGEFGAHLMFKAVAGETPPLREQILQDSYRLWLFNGCRTEDYIKNIRQDSQVNQHLNERNLDLFFTKQTLYWHNTTANIMAFLDGVTAQDNTAGLLKRLGQANPENVSGGRTHARQGFDDNPLYNSVKS